MKIPQFLYHVTRKSNLKSIRLHGLKATLDEILQSGDEYDKPGVNLLHSVEDYPFNITEKYIVLTINTSKLNKKKFIKFDSWWYRYYANIHRKSIV